MSFLDDILSGAKDELQKQIPTIKDYLGSKITGAVNKATGTKVTPVPVNSSVSTGIDFNSALPVIAVLAIGAALILRK